jgi:uncharacterized protein YndB with AHSA1/START domain
MASPSITALQRTEIGNTETRVFWGTPQRVFRLFSDPSFAAHAIPRMSGRVKIQEMDLRPGGRYSIEVERRNGSKARFFGVYLEVDPPRRIVNTFEVSTLPGVIAIETDEFEPVGDSTRVTIRWQYASRDDLERMTGPIVGDDLAALWENVIQISERTR